MGPSDEREFEHRFRVHALFESPDLPETGAVARVDAAAATIMSTVYFDTGDLTLARWGISLCRREHDADEHWVLSLPIAERDSPVRDVITMPIEPGGGGCSHVLARHRRSCSAGGGGQAHRHPVDGTEFGRPP